MSYLKIDSTVAGNHTHETLMKQVIIPFVNEVLGEEVEYIEIGTKPAFRFYKNGQPLNIAYASSENATTSVTKLRLYPYIYVSGAWAAFQNSTSLFYYASNSIKGSVDINNAWDFSLPSCHILRVEKYRDLIMFGGVNISSDVSAAWVELGFIITQDTNSNTVLLAKNYESNNTLHCYDDIHGVYNCALEYPNVNLSGQIKLSSFGVGNIKIPIFYAHRNYSASSGEWNTLHGSLMSEYYDAPVLSEALTVDGQTFDALFTRISLSDTTGGALFIKH